MKASELIDRLRALSAEIGGDPEVVGQAHGCCEHGHEILAVERGGPLEEGSYTSSAEIVIRV
jgi:hypothetical protein